MRCNVNRIVVEQNTSIGTINQALLIAQKTGIKTILVKNGIYHEKIKITLDGLTLFGEDQNKTIITNSDYAKKIHEDGKEFNTFRTYTVMVLANNVKIRNITIRNDAGPGSVVGQAVSLSVTGDLIEIEKCNLVGHQDTLFLGPLPKDLLERYQNLLPKDELIFPINHRVMIKSTVIQGDVDFVFGCANAYFITCEFISNPGNGYVFAPSTDEIDDFGFVVVNSKFTGKKANSKVYLARPWRDAGKLILVDCVMDSHIVDEGFHHWEGTTRYLTCRFFERGTTYLDGHFFERVSYVSDISDQELISLFNSYNWFL